LSEGDPGKSLTDPYSVVISEKMAAKYFGTSDPLGSTLFYNETPLRITGIMKDAPDNTHIVCEFIISYSTLKALGQLPEQPWNSWGDDMTYLLLKNNSKVSSLVPKLDEMLSKNAGDWLASRMKFDMQPLNEIHWDTEARGDIGNKGNKTYVYIFLSASLFVLIIACFNFLNLSISQYLGRMKEIGIRKTAGAQRQQMIIQFMTESFILIIISGLISVYLFETLYTWLYSYLGINFVITDRHFLLLALLVFLIIIVVGALAGAYPAFYFSRFRPIEILKNEITGTKRKLTFRKILVIFQFSISIILLAGTIVVFRQLNYMKNSSLGFTKENVVLVNLHGLLSPDGNKYEVLREELLKNPNIRYVTGAYTLPGINSQMNIGVRRDGETSENSINLQALPADYGFVNSLGLEILEGRDFSSEFSTDRLESVILNQAAVTALRLEKPVGTKLFIPGEAYKNGVTVIGVVRDFHVQSFHNKINPILIFINPEMYSVMAIRINPQNTDETMGYLESTCNKILPGITPAYTFLDEAYDNLYNTEVKSSQLLTVFTLLALFISCLGLFGFTMFLVSKRIREIGIRKAMGAQAAGISLLLTGQFLIWIVVSGIIAFPLAYLIITKWLSSFAFRKGRLVDIRSGTLL
jgi:putative ABC transport system permease protein